MIGLRLVVKGADLSDPERTAARVAADAAARAAARIVVARRVRDGGDAHEAGRATPHVVFIR